VVTVSEPTHDDGRHRITIPVDADRTPAASTRVAATVARQCSLPLEFVATAGPRRNDHLEARLRTRCAHATEAGAPTATWRLLDSAAGGVDGYLNWSGSCLRCVGRAHVPGPSMARHSAVPLLVVGPGCRPPAAGYRQVVVGVDGASSHSTQVAAVATALARRLGADVVLIEVFVPNTAFGDVPECAHLHRVAHDVGLPRAMFETLHDRHPADGILRFVGHDDETIIAVGSCARQRRRGVPGALVRRARCPVLVVPPSAVPLRDLAVQAAPVC
jgi:hypothetical protein